MTIVRAFDVNATLNVRANSPATTLGTRFEARFAKQLARSKANIVIRNPVFDYERKDGSLGRCAPDIVFLPPAALCVSLGEVVVIEIKHTLVPEAYTKLNELYLPIVRLLYPGKDVRGLIVVRNLVLGGPSGGFSVSEALSYNPPILHWRGAGPVRLMT